MLVYCSLKFDCLTEQVRFTYTVLLKHNIEVRLFRQFLCTAKISYAEPGKIWTEFYESQKKCSEFTATSFPGSLIWVSPRSLQGAVR